MKIILEVVSLVAIVIGMIFIFQGWSVSTLDLEDPFALIASANASNKIDNGIILLLPGVVVFLYLKLRS